MKRRINTLFLLFALGTGSCALALDEMNATPEQRDTVPADAAISRAPLLDLSLLGVIALGVLGLFWIRRHTSEL